MLRRVAVVHAEQIVRFARRFPVFGRPCVVNLFEYCQYHYHAFILLFVDVCFPRLALTSRKWCGSPRDFRSQALKMQGRILRWPVTRDWWGRCRFQGRLNTASNRRRQAPRRHERESSRQVPSAGRPRIRALPKLPPSRRPQYQCDLCRSGQAVALRLSAIHQATVPVSPGRQKSEQRGPTPRPGPRFQCGPGHWLPILSIPEFRPLCGI